MSGYDAMLSTMIELLEGAYPYVEQNVLELDPGHSCGPESVCDGNCVDFSRASHQLYLMHRAISAGRAALAEGK